MLSWGLPVQKQPGPPVTVLRTATTPTIVGRHRMRSHYQESAIGRFRGYAAETAVLFAAVLVCGGCYDGKMIIDRVRSAALRNRLEEVDLGTFRTTMPRDPATNAFAEIEIHVFGTAPRYQVRSIERQLDDDGYRLRHDTLLAVRNTTLEELAEPDLAKLRERIEQVVNNVLDDAPVKSIGFYDLRITYQ
jgi:hypothetical protein